MQQITWFPVLIFMGALAIYVLVDHLRSRDRKRSSRAGFRRMQSPHSRPRHREADAMPRAAFKQPHHAGARRAFYR